MNRIQFRELHRNGVLKIKRSFLDNLLPSQTDPTQDVPVKNIQMLANGLPLNVKQLSMQPSGRSPQQLEAYERRNTDIFDAVGELQKNERVLDGSLRDNKKFNDLNFIKNEK